MHGFARTLYESIFEKMAMVMVNVRSAGRDLRRHAIFDSYVSDKKRIISYNLGMALAKFYSQELLDIPHLIHVETLKKQNAVTFIAQTGTVRPREPDLVGQTSEGDWHIFEAKGVSGSTGQLPGKIADAKIQVNQVSAIQNSSPSTRNACASYIGADRILTLLEDPPSDAEKSIAVETGKFLKAYYAPYFLADQIEGVIRRSLRMEGRSFEAIELRSGNQKLTIGLDTEVLSAISSSTSDFPGQVRIKLRTEDLPERAQYSIGPDGVLLQYEASS
nr:hypothetical protein [uncultured Undibacterium sp.]